MNNSQNKADWQKEVEKGERFEFGSNWVDFVSNVNESHIKAAEKSLLEFIDKEQLHGKSFIDIGCGSGLHSLVAKQNNAEVYSVDYDPNSVAATLSLKKKYYPEDDAWQVEQASILDNEFVSRLKQYDIVYSWGVLHHTGQMWKAIDNAMSLVKPKGKFFIAIYNNQGLKSKFWWQIKYLYNKMPAPLKKPFAYTLGLSFNAINIIKYTMMFKPAVAIKPLINYKKRRGMNIWNDIIDWMGGFPYEYASVDQMNQYFAKNGFELKKVKPDTSLGCNQFLYIKR